MGYLIQAISLLVKEALLVRTSKHNYLTGINCTYMYTHMFSGSFGRLQQRLVGEVISLNKDTCTLPWFQPAHTCTQLHTIKKHSNQTLKENNQLHSTKHPHAYMNMYMYMYRYMYLTTNM